MGDAAQIEPADWHLAAQPAPDFEVDQRISWCGLETATLMRCGVSLRGPPQIPLSSGTFWWWLAMDSLCSENREDFYVVWWPINSAILDMGRLKCLSVDCRTES